MKIVMNPTRFNGLFYSNHEQLGWIFYDLRPNLDGTIKDGGYVISTATFASERDLLSQEAIVAARREFELLPGAFESEIVEHAEIMRAMRVPRFLDIYFRISNDSIELFREYNRPPDSRQVIGLEKDDTDDGWSHAWFYIDESTPCWHMQFESTFDKSLDDATMHAAGEVETLDIAEPLASAVVKFDMPVRNMMTPFGELPYKFGELPGAVIDLIASRWNSCDDHNAAPAAH